MKSARHAQFHEKEKNKRLSHAILSVNMTDIKSVEQTNTFWTSAKLDRKQLDVELVERIRPDCFRDLSIWKLTY